MTAVSNGYLLAHCHPEFLHLHLFGETGGVTGKRMAPSGLARVVPKDNLAGNKGLSYCCFSAELICKKGLE